MPEVLCIGALVVRLRRSERARRMVLRVPRDDGAGGAPTLTLPMGVSRAAGRAFLIDKEPWLRQRLAERPPRVPVRIGTRLPLGEDGLHIVAASGRRIERLRGVLAVPEHRPVGVAVAAYLKLAAREALAVSVDAHAARLGLAPRRIRLGDPRGRWGSCSSEGDLMFSWRLAMAPSGVLDYVAAHEVAHLAEMNHSERFWAHVRRLRPGYETERDWLRRNGAGLHAYDFTSGERD